MNVRVKICGITTAADARLVGSLGGDAVGLNFYPSSPRCLELARAVEIADSVRGEVLLCGLFVNAAVDQIRAAHQAVGLDLLQLHGDEPPKFLAEVREALDPAPAIMRAFRVDSRGLPPVLEYLETCRGQEALPQFVLLDAYQSGAYGGTGAIGDWNAARQYAQMKDQPPLVLAGGLKPGNVAQAVREVQPTAVDTASGVESAPGKKDVARLQEFIAQAIAALEELED